MRLLGLFLCLLIAACETPEPYRIAPQPDDTRYGAQVPAGTTAFDNQSLAEVFAQLMHHQEWGVERVRLTRYEAPIRVDLKGDGLGQYMAFLDRFLGELRDRSGVDIRRVATGGNMHVTFVPGGEFRDSVSAQCFVVPGAPSWSDYTDNPRRYSWQRGDALRRITETTIFIPDTLQPHGVRECLMEEVVQGLGPGNDLFGLHDTIFNDDEAHLWPTSLDYLMVRVLYRPEMRTGLLRAETTALARRILDEINPEGRDAPPLPPIRQVRMQGWRDDIISVGKDQPRAGVLRRRLQRLTNQAEELAPFSNYHCYALMRLADRTARDLPAEGIALAQEALRICGAVHRADDIRLAQIRFVLMHARADLSQWQEALDLADGLEQTFLGHGHEFQLVAFYSLLYKVQRNLGDRAAADAAFAKALAWGAYALGDDHRLVKLWRAF